MTAPAPFISVSVDHDADAAYVTLSTNPVVRTIAVTPEVNLDLDDMNIAVGIEVLTLSAEVPYSRLVTEYHIHSQVADRLRLIQPSAAFFVSRVQVGSSSAHSPDHTSQPASS